MPRVVGAQGNEGCASRPPRPALLSPVRIVDMDELSEARTGSAHSLSGAHRLIKALELPYQKTRPSHLKAVPVAWARLEKLPDKLREIARDNA